MTRLSKYTMNFIDCDW